MMSFSVRKAIKQGKVSVRLCHLILYSEGTGILYSSEIIGLVVQPNNGVTLITVTAKEA